MIIPDWNGNPYHSLDYELKHTFGRKLYKLSLDGGMTCPNRDGTCGSRGCIFCSEGGSGDFAAPLGGDVWKQIEAAKERIRKKMPPADGSADYIAYFQSFTNTYASTDYLSQLFSRAISHPEIAALSIATRPDCLPDETIALLSSLNRIKPVWVELGLQTIHEDTARLIRRGYALSVFEEALKKLKAAGLTVIVHVILGLPGESRERMTETIAWLADRPIDGIKLQLLHVLKGTDLAAMYQSDPFPVFSMEEYIDFVIDCVELLPPELTVHRLTGDGPKNLLIAPLWSADKKRVLNTLSRRFKERGTWQGRRKCSLSPCYGSSGFSDGSCCNGSSGRISLTRPFSSTAAPKDSPVM